MKNNVVFDFETRSECDLKRSGAFKYSLDPTTMPTCLVVKIKNALYLFKFEQINKPWETYEVGFRTLWKDIINYGYTFTGHNVFFETVIYKNILVKRYGWPDIPFRQFRCTAAKAAACAIPRSLEGAGTALDLPIQKDKRGYVAMMATCKPTKKWKLWKEIQDTIEAGGSLSKKKQIKSLEPEPPKFLEYKDNPTLWEVLYEYCIIDVKTEEKLDEALPDLIPFEQEVFFLNQKINWRGIKIDLRTVHKIVDIMAIENKIKLKELDELTMGLVTKVGARKSILDFLMLEKIELPDIRSKTVDDVLKKEGLDTDMKRLLEIRKALSKVSTKKYQAFLDRANEEDERVRDILLYHGASTGRDSGTGIQPQNFPRGIIEISENRPYAPVNNVIENDTEMLKLLYGDNLSFLFSSIIRNMIIPSKGSELFVADFSKIEVAVLWWLADNKAGLEVLKSGKDPYVYMAVANTGKAYGDITYDERQLGKAQVLGAGFGLGWEKFQTAAWDMYRLKLTEEQSFKAIKSYRNANSEVPALWRAYEGAAIDAIETGQKIKAGKCTFFVSNDFLWVELPSKRKLAYRSPKLGHRVKEYRTLEPHPVTGEMTKVTKIGQPKKTIEFLGLAPDKRKMRDEVTWGGTLTENIVQATARDLMKNGELLLEKTGYKVLLTVHDEIICEKEIGTGQLEDFTKIMCTRPIWANKDLPIDAKGWRGERYRK